MFKIPSPVILLKVTVGVLVVPLVTVIVPIVAEPEVTCGVMLALVRLIEFAPLYVIVKLTEPALFTNVVEGLPIVTVGGVLSTSIVPLAAEPMSVLPAIS